MYRRRLKYIEHGCWQPTKYLDKASARSRFSLPQDVKLIVSVGRLSELKNQTALVAALPSLPGVHLALAGDGPASAQLIQLAQANGSSDRLHMVGEVPRSEVFDFLAAGDVFAFPSHSETFGLAAVEAAIAGIPVIANNLAVLRDVLMDDNGDPAALFADTPDAEGFVGPINRVLGEAELTGRLTSSGRALAEKYDPDRMVAAYAALLENDA